MAYCGPRGIPRSQFLRWSRTDQEDALEWAAYEGRRCKNCGLHPEDDPADWHAHLEQCRGCQARDRVLEAPEAKSERGVYAAITSGPAHACPRCQPLDD